jgi:hypothetical protein
MSDNQTISDGVNSECNLLLYQDKKTVLTPNYTIKQKNNDKPQTSLSEQEIDLLKQRAIEEHAKYLGMDLIVDKEFLWIAHQSLLAPLPPDWEQFESPDGEIYYFHQPSNESSWIHPHDDHYREMFKKEKKNKIVNTSDKKIDDNFTKLYNTRKNVSKLIDTDLNLIHAKIKPTMTECNPNLWETRITREKHDESIPHLLKPSPSSTFCLLNIFRCF